MSKYSELANKLARQVIVGEPTGRNPLGQEAAAALRELEAERDMLREAVEFIAEAHDAGRHDGLPEPCPAHDAETMFAVARAALQQEGK